MLIQPGIIVSSLFGYILLYLIPLIPIAFLSIKPLQGIILGKDGAELQAAARLFLLLGMNAVQLRLFARPGTEKADVDVGRARLRHGRQTHLAEDVDAVGRGADADLLQVGFGE